MSEDFDESLRAPGSRLLHLIDRAASRPATAVAVLGVDLVWVGAEFGVELPVPVGDDLPDPGRRVHSGDGVRHPAHSEPEPVATQRKLDEILRSLPQADNSLIALEDASDAQLRRARDHHRGLRAEALEAT